MHIPAVLLPPILLATAVIGSPVSNEPLSKEVQDHVLSSRSGALMKRFFWCNGTDSDTICPKGDTMVPISACSCWMLSEVGRLNQVTPPVGDETHVTCPPKPPNPGGCPAITDAERAEAAKELSPQSESKSVGIEQKVAKQQSMQLSCGVLSGSEASGSLMLNCTTGSN